MVTKLQRTRVYYLFCAVLLLLMALTVRLAYVHLVQGPHYARMATSQRLQPQIVAPRRGRIFDINLQPLAVSVPVDAVYAFPSLIRDPQAVASQIGPHLQTGEEQLVQLLSSDRNTVWLHRRLEPEAAAALKKMRIAGLRFVTRQQRYYSQDSLAAQVLGFSGVDNQGLEGLEYYYDHILFGTPGRVEQERDARREAIPEGRQAFTPPVDGHDIVLTIDSVVQYLAEKELQSAVTESNSEYGILIAIDPSTGGILANAVYPSYDPNNFASYPASSRRNVAVTDSFEPGSTFKLFTGAAALSLGLITEDRLFYSGPQWEVGGGVIRSWDNVGSGEHDFATAMVRSDNITFAKLAAEMGPEQFYPYIRGFGFGSTLGVDFPGEAAGLAYAPGQIRFGETLQWANIGFGQGIAVTPLQLVAAVAALGNQGQLMRPYFVSEIRDVHGRLVEKTEPKVIGQPVDLATATTMLELMRDVVVRGTGGRAEVAGYFPGGKTGTAQVAEAGGYGDKRVASFVGLAPYDQPAVAVVVVLYNPRAGVSFGGVLAAPVFARFIEPTLEYLGVPRRTVSIERSSLTQVPNVRNLPVNEAEALLTGAGLQVTAADRPDAIILDQVPPPGSQVPPQTLISLFFHEATGVSHRQVMVPNVVGLSMRDAVAVLSEADLRPRIAGSGIAVKQVPGSGSLVPVGSVIQVEFSP